MNLFLVVYLIVTAVMLMNLLIAAFSDTYSKLTKEAANELGYAFSRICVEYHGDDYLLPSPFNLPHFACRLLVDSCQSFGKAGSTASRGLSRMASLRPSHVSQLALLNVNREAGDEGDGGGEESPAAKVCQVE